MKRGESSDNEESVEFQPTVSSLQRFSDGLQVGEHFGPRYTIVRKLGEGGMGAVYLAQDHALNRQVALKLIRPVLSEHTLALERFKREIALGVKITHKNILRIHDLGEVEGLRYVSMDYVQGKDLGVLLKEEKELPVDRVVAILKQLCLGLKAAHDEGIIHRDLKPPNILLDAQDHVYITDFGLARTVEAQEESLTETGQVPGTPLYMSPEQIKGERIDTRSDLYALGIVLFEMLTGKFPFEKSGNFRVLVQRIRNRPINPKTVRPSVPDFLASITMKCMEPDPDRRYQNPGEILEDIEQQKIRSSFRNFQVNQAKRIATIAIGVVILALIAFAVGKKITGPNDPVARAVAILPVENGAGDVASQWIATGLQDSLTTELREVPGVRLVSREHINRLLATSGKTPDLTRTIGESCNASSVIKGKIIKSGGANHVVVERFDFVESEVKSVMFESSGRFDEAFTEIVSGLKSDWNVSHREAFGTKGAEDLEVFYRALALLENGEPENAARLLTKIGKSSVLFSRTQLQLAKIYEISDAPGAKQFLASLDPSKLFPYERFERQYIQARMSGDRAAVEKSFDQWSRAYPMDSELLTQIGDHYADQEEWIKALENYRKALELDPKNVRLLTSVGRTEMKKGNPQTALKFLIEASSLQKLLNETERADLLNMLGVAYRQLEYHESALEHFQRALAIRKKLNDEKGTGTLLGNIGNVLRDMGRYEDATKAYEEALVLSEKNDDPKISARMLNNLGYVAERSGQLEDALGYYKRALAAARSANLQGEAANRMNNIGWIYFLKGDFDDAATYFELGLKQVPSDDVLTTATLLLSRGNLFIDRGQYSKALGDFRKSLELLQGTENQLITGFLLLDNARCLLLTGDISSAAGFIERAEKIASQMKSNDLQANLLFVKANLARLQGNNQGSLKLMDEAVRIAAATRDLTYILPSDLEYASLQIDSDQVDSAVNRISGTLEHATKAGFQPLAVKAHVVLARVFWKKNLKQKASTQLEQAFRLANDIDIPESKLQANILAAEINHVPGKNSPVAFQHFQKALETMSTLHANCGEKSKFFISQKHLQDFLRLAATAYSERGKQKEFEKYSRWILSSQSIR